MPRILLLGAGGQLGAQLNRVLRAGDGELTALGRGELDFTDSAALREAVRRVRPEILINAAAYTAVDRAEQEQELARQVNAAAPGILAEELVTASGGKGWLVHYSTDYVFDGSGKRPWRETDATGPLNVYGQTKLDGEAAIAATKCRHVILRTSWVYAAEGRNFLQTMLRLGRERERLSIVDDQIGAPTSAEAIAEATRKVLGRLGDENAAEASGVYHLTCAGETSWCGFAKAIFERFQSQQAVPEVTPIPTEAYPTPARRPKNSRLDCGKAAGRFGVQMPRWEAALDEVTATIIAGSQEA